MEQVAISSGNGQTPCDHNSTTDLLDRLNFPAPTRSTVVKVAGNGVPRAVDQGCVALLSGFEMRWSSGVIVETEAYSPEQKQTGFTRATAAAVCV